MLKVRQSRGRFMVFSCFCVSLLLEGLQRVSGLLFVETAVLLGCTRQEAVLPFVLSRAIVDVADPVKWVLRGNKTPGPLIVCGCLLSALGIGLASIANNVLSLTVFWGVLVGSGMGIASPLLSEQLNQHDSKHVFSSITFLSPSFGCIILPFFMQALVDNYGLSSCYIILSGIVLSSIPLILVAMYKIEIRLPKLKWRFRKRSKRYKVSINGVEKVQSFKQQKIQEFSNESFLKNMEPDYIRSVSEKSQSQPSLTSEQSDNTTGTFNSSGSHSDASTNKHVDHEIKTSSFLGNNILPNNIAELSREIKDYERNRMVFEQSFNKNDSLSSVSNIKDTELDECENKMSDDRRIYNSLTTGSSTEKICNKTAEFDNSVPSTQKDIMSSAIIGSTVQSLHVTKSVKPGINDSRASFPLDIKVRVVEYTFSSKDMLLGTLKKYSNQSTRKEFRQHSNPIDFTQIISNKSKLPFLPNQSRKPVPNMYLISEDIEWNAQRHNLNNNDEVSWWFKCKELLYKFKRLIQPCCLVIFYASVIYEFTLVTLLTIFADFATDIDGPDAKPSAVMAAFGVGGIIGQLSLTKYGHRLLVDGTHAAAALIFMINGLTVAGVLWSANSSWLAGFYGVLGFLEVAVLMTIDKLASDLIDPSTKEVLLSMSRCLSGFGILCLPYAIGLCREEGGDYDSLLQITSCLSVLCAALTYFLPKLTPKPHRSENSELQ